MMNFNNIFWICHHIGFGGDAFTIFLNLHLDQSTKYDINRKRVRTSKSGYLLNWAWYYDKWKEVQKPDPNLYKRLNNNGSRQFCQAHFLQHEDEIIEKFPGSNTIALLAESQENADIYYRHGHAKLSDQLIYPSWYLVQRANLVLKLKENQDFADRMVKQQLTHYQYRGIAYADRKGLVAQDLDDPLKMWQDSNDLTFQPTRDIVLSDNLTWTIDHPDKIVFYIDRLVNPVTHEFDDDYYQNMCNTLNLTPNIGLYHQFWSWWIARQPPVDYEPNLSWVKINSRSRSLA